jgi:hypothetical protein
MRLPLLVAAAVFVLTACGSGDTATLRPSEGASTERYEVAAGFVLESPEHGPELCLDGVADSYPPQCGGVPIVNWDWAAVDGEESASGTTRGTYFVVGSYDGDVLTLTEPAGPPRESTALPADPITTPCPEPNGGWQVVDGTRIAESDLHAALQAARAAPDHSGFWIDYLVEPSDEAHHGDEIVVNAAFTGDLARHEQELRALWGGALCVVQHSKTLNELRATQEELFATVGPELGLHLTFAAVDETRGVVEVGVVAISDEQRAALDERYGPGTVEVEPGLVIRTADG